MERMVFRMGISPVESNMKIGPVRSHLYNYAFAKKAALDGRESLFVMKCDDTDPAKHEKEKFKGLYSFFAGFLGMDIDIHPFNSQEKIGASLFQSERGHIYGRWLEKLLESGFAFVEENSGVVLFSIEKFAKAHPSPIEIEDLLFGKIVFRPESLLKEGLFSFPLRRSDGSYLYHFATTVDDQELSVTHVFRGQDKISAAHFQEMLRIVLGFSSKKYVHTPLLVDADGKRLSGNVRFDDFLRDGITKQSLISYIVSSGYGDPDELYPALEGFISGFNPKKLHKANGMFDRKKLERVNRKLIGKCGQEEYLSALCLYADRFGAGHSEIALRSDPALQKMLFSFRKNPDESVEFLEKLFNPVFRLPDPVLLESIKRIIEKLEKESCATDIHSLSNGLDQSVFFQSLRWILTGAVHGADVATTYSFFQEKNLLGKRVKEAKAAVQNYV